MSNAPLCLVPPLMQCAWRQLPALQDAIYETSFEDVMARLRAGNASEAILLDASVLKCERDLRSLRELAPLAPVLVVLHEPRAEVLNLAQALRCEVVCGRPDAGVVDGFLSRARRAGRLSSHDVHAWIDHLVRARTLRPRDLELIPVVLGEQDEDAVRERLGFSPAQMTRRMRALCRRCEARTPMGAARNLLRDALVHGRPDAAPARSAHESLRPAMAC